jgi:hypothetical protein
MNQYLAQVLSKKLGVVATAIIVLSAVCESRPQVAGPVVWVIGGITAVYLVCQTFLDNKEKKHEGS